MVTNISAACDAKRAKQHTMTVCVHRLLVLVGLLNRWCLENESSVVVVVVVGRAGVVLVVVVVVVVVVVAIVDALL